MLHSSSDKYFLFQSKAVIHPTMEWETGSFHIVVSIWDIGVCNRKTNLGRTESKTLK